MFQGYRTYVGILIAVAPTIANIFGYEVTTAFGEQFPVAVDSVMQLIGSAIAVYGRLKADTPGWLAKRAQ